MNRDDILEALGSALFLLLLGACVILGLAL